MAPFVHSSIKFYEKYVRNWKKIKWIYLKPPTTEITNESTKEIINNPLGIKFG